MNAFEDIPMFDMEEPPKRKKPPGPTGIKWVKVTARHRYPCNTCIEAIGTENQSGIKQAVYVREDHGDGSGTKAATAHCVFHAALLKDRDQRAGVWKG